jgi:hypothetical protein
MQNTVKLILAPVNGGPFNCLPSREVEVACERVLCNDVVFPWEAHPHGMRLWAVGNEFGIVGAVWAGCEQDALDELVDAGLGDSFLVPEDDQASASEDEQEEWAHLGNAGEPCDLTYAWIQPVDLSRCGAPVLCAFAEARSSASDTLDF